MSSTAQRGDLVQLLRLTRPDVFLLVIAGTCALGTSILTAAQGLFLGPLVRILSGTHDAGRPATVPFLEKLSGLTFGSWGGRSVALLTLLVSVVTLRAVTLALEDATW